MTRHPLLAAVATLGLVAQTAQAADTACTVLHASLCDTQGCADAAAAARTALTLNIASGLVVLRIDGQSFRAILRLPDPGPTVSLNGNLVSVQRGGPVAQTNLVMTGPPVHLVTVAATTGATRLHAAFTCGRPSGGS